MSTPSSLPGSATLVRLFPLPKLVFFPHVMQPLHIFEPRYRQMTTDALAGDQSIALVLPRPGWEKDYTEKPAIHSVACMGRIVADHRLDDGCCNILLRGEARIRIIEEIPTDKLYRCARVELLQEKPVSDAIQDSHWRKMLLRKTGDWFPNQGEVVEHLRKLLEGDLPLGMLCDIMTYALPLDAEFKQALLEELNVEIRLQRLHDWLDVKQSAAPRKFPPTFSVN